MTLFAGASGIGSRRLTARRPSVVSVLDVGSTKVCCMIARLTPRDPGELLPGRTHGIEALGLGHVRSRGIKSGVVIDLDAAELAIRHAVDAAERAARVTVDSLIVNVSAGRLASETFTARVNLTGGRVSEGDISRVLVAGRNHAISPGRLAVHSIPIGYSLDEARAIRDPLNMMGERLGVDMHLASADTQTLRNLELSINRCHLSIASIVAAPYAAGLASLIDDEAELGTVVVDLGGGTTTMAVFMNGQFIHVDSVAIGGQHITNDIARGLSTRVEDAERLKVMHGSALSGASDERDLISVPALTDEDRDAPNHVPRSALTRIIRARVEETLELVRDRLNASGFAAIVGKRMVLTGGASQLNGLAEAARRILARNVRLGRPLGVAGLPEPARGPAFSAAVGLLIYPQIAAFEQFSGARSAAPLMTGTGGGYFSRMVQRFRESF
jgi:cell division protein FtsA